MDKNNPVVLPLRVRQAIYIIVTMVTAVIVPLWSAGIVNDVTLAVWTSVSGAGSLLAGFVSTVQSLRSK